MPDRMKERDKAIVTALVVLSLVVWLGFVFHRSPRFAGSLTGGVLAMTGSLLMLVPLAYAVIKRNKSVRRRVTRRVSMRTLLAWHIYAGIVGPMLVLIHSGHKFHSPLGIALTSMTLIVVVSGYVGRYLMGHLSTEIRDKKRMLGEVQGAYDRTARAIAGDASAVRRIRPLSRVTARLAANFFLPAQGSVPAEPTDTARVLRIAESMADLEFAIASNEMFKSAFRRWLKLHIALSAILYVLLGLHVWSAIHFGLRWFS